MSPRPRVRRLDDAAAVAEAAAEHLMRTVREVLDENRRAQLCLTGGSLGSKVWESVVARDDVDAVDWSRVDLWWGDERWLPAGDGERNDTQNDAAGLRRVPIPAAQVHRVLGPDATGSAEEAATSYAESIRQHGKGGFDVVLLGMGPDGHVASLFPHHPAQQVQDAIAVAVHDSPKPPSDRVSLTFEALERSQRVWFLVAGEGKAEALARVLAGGADRWDVPAAGVRGLRETVWFVDEAAASRGR